MKIVVVCGMSDEKVHANLLPLVKLEGVELIFLIRRRPLQMPKVTNVSLPVWLQNILILAEIYRFVGLLWICLIKQPDVIYGIYFVPHGVYAAIAGWLFRIPVIQELIGTDRLKVMRSKILYSMLKKASRIGVRGQQSREQLIESGIDEKKMFTPISVNALDFNHFKPDVCQKKYDLIYCGRMDQNKQVNLLLQAVAELVITLPKLRVLLLGDGPQRQDLEALTDALNLGSTIEFVGNQPYEQIPYYLNQSRVFMMASAFEGLPVAMLEALSCGLPVVVPNVGDIGDVAQHGINALLVDSPSVKAYVEAFTMLLNDDQTYRQLATGALKTRQALVEQFTLEKASADFRQILDEITSETKA